MGNQRELSPAEKALRDLEKLKESFDANLKMVTELKKYFRERAEKEKTIQKRDQEELKMLPRKARKNA